MAQEPAVEPSGPAVAPPLIDTPAARDALTCPLCGYSLRGLAGAAQPHCPECGYRFVWPELLRARQHRHPYLFEHHPGHYGRSFVRTLAGGMRPARFWSSLNAGHEIRPRRLLVYAWSVATVILLFGFAGTYVLNAVALYRENSAYLAMIGGMGLVARRSVPLPPEPAFFRAALGLSVDDDQVELYLLAAALLWPWLTLASLLVFQASMRRAHIGWRHALRCAVYAGDVMLWWGPALAVLGVMRWAGWLGSDIAWDSRLAARQNTACFLVLLFVAAYRLGVAYRRYLRFDRPWATVLASQLVVLLFLTTALSLVYIDFWMLMPL